MATKVAEEYVTRREAAELAGVHLNTVRLWESTGRVSTVKAEGSGVVMIPRAQILEIIESRRSNHMDEAAKNAVLEAENKMLREELLERKRDYQQLLDRLIQIAGPQEGSGQ